MRVISGDCGGIPLKAVPGKTTRPTTDKIKEAMFNLIGQYLSGGAVLDFYAGSGALGIEALSRGGDVVYGFERDRKAIATIEQNVDKVHATARYHLFKGDNQKRLKQLRMDEPDLQFQWVFLDPPYKAQRLVPLLEEFQAENWLDEEVIVVCELGAEDTLPDQISQLHKVKEAVYGITRIVCYCFPLDISQTDE
ncbi:MAG: 16S rRNA (guanine(966)-N(2))-methyltransferase RsmD [Aerococcus sp.]|nr:16S rRNA (guanine(966)-N(2))-methyltransferase RsmD [Aerococcus sp.]